MRCPFGQSSKGAILGLLAILVTGCELLPDMRLATIARSLDLTVTAANRVGSGDSAAFVFAVANRGREAINACLGPSRSVLYHSSSGLGTSFTFVDHPGCVQEFTIQPGETMTWPETLEVPRLSQGRVEVEVGIQIANPQRCGCFGCSTIELKSKQYVIQ